MAQKEEIIQALINNSFFLYKNSSPILFYLPGSDLDAIEPLELIQLAFQAGIEFEKNKEKYQEGI